MPTSYTSLLGLALPVTGELSGSWGDTVNNSITALLDTAVAGTTTLSTDADVTLTTTTGAANQARQAILLCSGARTALRTITAPAASKIYTIINSTTGGFSVKIVGVGPTTGITIPAGAQVTVAWNGSDFVDATDYIAGNFAVGGNVTGGTWQGSVINPTYGGTGVNNATRTLTINTNGGTLDFTGASTVMTLPSTSQTLAGLGLAQTFTAAQTFRAANSVRVEAAATQDAVVLAGRAGGTGSFAVTLTPTTLTASRTITLPDASVTIPSGTIAVLGTAQTFTAAQTFRAANAVRSEAAATQDAVVLAGRAGGTGSFAVTLTPTTLTANRTITLPDGAVTLTSGTTAVLGTAQTFTAAQTFRAASAVRSEAAATQDAIVLAGRAGGTGSFAATITTATLAANVTHTLPAITGTLATLANTAQTFAGATTFSNATTTFSNALPVVAVPTNGLTIQPLSPSQSTLYPVIFSNAPTGTWTSNAGVGVQFYTSANITLNSTAYKAGEIVFAYNDNSSGTTLDLSLFTPLGNKQRALTADATYSQVALGTLANTDLAGAVSNDLVYDFADTGTFSAGANAACVVRSTTSDGMPTIAPQPSYGTFAGTQAGAIITSRSVAPSISFGAYTTAVGSGAGAINLADAVVGPLAVTTGAYNTYLGVGAGNISLDTDGAFTRGSYNIGVGFAAGAAVAYDIGDYNIAIGAHSLQSQFGSIGSYNVAIGDNAGFTNIGDRNTLIGASAGSSLPALATGVTLIGGISGSAIPSNYDVAIGNGTPGTADLALYATGADGLGGGFTDIYFGTSASTAVNLRNVTGLKVFDSEFRIVDSADATKVANFECSGLTTATTRTLTVPNASGTIALLSLAQTWSATQTFAAVTLNGTVTSGNIAFTLSGTTNNLSLNAGQTTGTIVVGGTAATGAITVGQSTGAQTLNLATGATTSATTKTVNIGTAGVSGSITNVNIGSATAGATGKTTINSEWTQVQAFAAEAPTTVNAATYTALITEFSLIFTTTNCTLTLPAAASFTGRMLMVKNITANSVTSASSNVVPLASATAGTAILAATAGKFALLQSNGTNWVVMMAN